jgi:hypothetical protein
MKFKDLILGNILETSNEFVINQYKNHTDRYEEVKEIKEETTKRRKKSEE